MVHQAERPTGAMGVVMGWVLEAGNAVQNRTTVAGLSPPAGGAVLEVGFGPGHALEMLCRAHRLALIAGVDHSELMVRTAQRRLDRGRRGAGLDLRLGDAADLPFPDRRFDTVFAVNTFHQWPDQPSALAEMVGVLRPGGEIVLSLRDFRVPGRFEPPGAGAWHAVEALEGLRRLGLEAEVREVVHSPKRATFLVRGRKSG